MAEWSPKYISQQARSRAFYNFDDGDAPTDGEYRLYTVAIELENGTDFTRSEHSEGGFMLRPTGWRLKVSMRWIAIDVFAGKPEKESNWYFERLKEMEEAADMPDELRDLVNRVLATFPEPPTSPA